ncbi:MAG: FtsX-like permease family protein, partial [Bacteroidota bacterium]
TDYQGTPAGSDPVYGYILSGIAACILFIACINFINLSVAGAVKRAPEIGCRKILGASRKQLIIQFMVESMLVSTLSFILAAAVTWLLLPFFNELAEKRLSLSYLFDATMIESLLLLYFLCFVGAGFYPALVLSGKKSLHKKSKNYLSQSLVIGQFAVAILLIIGMLFTNRQLQYMTHAASGYNEKNLLEFTVDKAVMNQELMDNCKTNFTLVRGVEKVGYANIGKFGGKTIAGGREFAAVYERIDENYLSVLQTTLLKGRYFSPGFRADVNQSVLVNETFAQAAGWKDPVGETIDYMNIPGMGEQKMNVVGVIKDYHFESLREKIKPQVFCMLPQLPMGRFVVRLKTVDPVTTIKALDKTYHSLFPEHPFAYSFKDDSIQKNYASEARWKKIIACSAVVAIFIACIGLFGLAMLNTEKRRKEIAIRKLLGAGIVQLLQLISFDFLQLVLTALLIAIPVGWYFSVKWLEQFAYRIQNSWWLFFSAGFIAVGMAVLTIGFQVIKAAVANPVSSLKNQ